MRRNERVGGFTLIELLIVFAVIAMIVALVPMAFGRLTEAAEYRDTVRAALADMRAARQLAMSSGQETRFTVHLPSRTFGVEGMAQHEVPKPLEMHAIMAAQESSADDTLAIRFLPYGGASGGSLDILRPSGIGVRLRVNWFTARVEQEAIE